ncbi:MAG: nucleotide-binding protein [Patescibacteria group bacterium]|jgi:predicted nucleotide-binding protein
MEKHDKNAEDIKKIYVHLQQLGIHNFFKSHQFDLFCEENGLEKIRDTIYKSLLHINNIPIKVKHYRNFEDMIIDFQEFPEGIVKPFLKDFLIEIYDKKQLQFIEIVVSFLTYYSRYNQNLNDGKPTPIDNDLMKIIGIDLLDLDFDERDIRMYFDIAGYDLNALLSMNDPKPVNIQNEPSNKTKRNTDESDQSKKVFIVHGHDEKLKSGVEEFLKSIGLEPIILHKQADLGKTIIEKVEYYSNVSFAVIVLTKDDFGGALPSGQANAYDLLLLKYVNNPTQIQSMSKKDQNLLSAQFIALIKEILSILKPRARQNVIFEFGYFIGLLGRKKVAALCEEGIDRPSDIDGLLYTPLDQRGEWKKKLAREIDAAGLKINEKYL